MMKKRNYVHSCNDGWNCLNMTDLNFKIYEKYHYEIYSYFWQIERRKEKKEREKEGKERRNVNCWWTENGVVMFRISTLSQSLQP